MEQKRTQDEFIKQVESLNKGFTVVDNSTGMNMTSELMSSTIGVSECIINLG